MNKRAESQIKYMKNDIKALDNDKANIFEGYIDTVVSSYSDNTIISYGSIFRRLFADIDPTNRDENYILTKILKYRSYGWCFYRYLYEQNYLGAEYRFLKSSQNYSMIQDILSTELSVKNIICCAKKLVDTYYDERYIVDTQNRNAISMVEKLFDERPGIKRSVESIKYLVSFLDQYSINSYNDFNDLLIEKCMEGCPTLAVARTCRKFLAFCVSHSNNECCLKLYPLSILNLESFAGKFIEGYRPILFNPLDNVPIHDKWMIIPNGEEKKSTQLTSESVLHLDFSIIKNESLKILLKEWFWSETTALNHRTVQAKFIMDFINMYFPKDETCTCISQIICANFKSFILSKYKLDNSRNRRIYPVLKFVRYIEEYSEIDVEKGCYLYLNNTVTRQKSKAIGIKKEHLILITSYINEHRNDNHNSFCFYVMFHIALNTEFRISQIVSLSYDCLKESMKKGEYVIESTMKQSGSEVVKQPCARIIKDIIYSYKKSTNEFRDNLRLALKQYLFVREECYGSVQKPFSRQSFSNYLKNVCNILNLPEYTAKNLRVTYITNAKEYISLNNLSNLTLLKVTNHASINTVNNHYIQENIIDALQATNGIIIGDVSIDGTISADVDNFDTEKEMSVANGLGFCQSKECTNQGPSPCQRCKYFFATLSNIPYYKQEIKRLKALNDGTLAPHDAEDNNNLVRLNTYILQKLLELKGEQQ